MLTVIGCGIAAGDISGEALEILKCCDTVIMQTEKMEIYKSLSQHKDVITCDDIYADAEDFDLLAKSICERLTAYDGDVCYAVFGSGLDDTAVEYTLSQLKQQGADVKVISGISLADKACAACGCIGNKTVMTATQSTEACFDPKSLLCITGIDGALLAGNIKCRLLDKYDPDQQVYIYNAKSGVESIPLYKLDRIKCFDHTTTLVIEQVPFDKLVSYNTDDLLYIMRRLRAADGCPWDREQTHQSLCRYLVEEAYEVADAVENDDPYSLADELGDVLLQVVFHAQIATEHVEFTYDDAVNAVCKKMIERHPHIFGDVKADTAQEVLNNWESIKREQRGQTHSEVLRSVIRSLPALMRAEKVGDKARHAGFDFDNAAQAMEKLREEISEFEEQMNNPQSDDAFMEMGDILFAAVNVARKCGIQPEMALNRSTDKFVDRFCALEQAVNADGKSIKELDMAVLDEYWDKIKSVDLP